MISILHHQFETCNYCNLSPVLGSLRILCFLIS